MQASLFAQVEFEKLFPRDSNASFVAVQCRAGSASSECASYHSTTCHIPYHHPRTGGNISKRIDVAFTHPFIRTRLFIAPPDSFASTRRFSLLVPCFLADFSLPNTLCCDASPARDFWTRIPTFAAQAETETWVPFANPYEEWQEDSGEKEGKGEEELEPLSGKSSTWMGRMYTEYPLTSVCNL